MPIPMSATSPTSTSSKACANPQNFPTLAPQEPPGPVVGLNVGGCLAQFLAE
jgi:hypothetical protein